MINDNNNIIISGTGRHARQAAVDCCTLIHAHEAAPSTRDGSVA